MAYEMFGINSPDEAANIFDGNPKNIKNWPRSVIEAIEAFQAEIMLSAKDKRNWWVDRQVHGRIDEYYISKEKPASNAFVSFGRFLKKTATSVGGFLGFGKRQTLFTGDGLVFGPQDCDYPIDKDSVVKINLGSFDIEGLITDEKNSDRRIEYEFVARFSISFWDCEGKPPSQLTIPPTVVNWSRLESADKAAIGKLFDGIVKQQLTADYRIAVDLKGNDKLKEIDRLKDLQEKIGKAIAEKEISIDTLTPTSSFSVCSLTDLIGDHKNIYGEAGKNTSADLAGATITKRDNDLLVTIESVEALPQFDKDSSLAFEIGFDQGRGSSNPLTPRDGVDMLYVVDIGYKITGFKETPGNQTSWQTQNVKKLSKGVSFTIPLSEVSKESKIYPLRVFTILAKFPDVEMDAMPNGGTKKCF